ncbi:MAG TPA: hypothetical protein VLU41_17095 [Ideonella sp.]|nr:hypothetical protein [Ideonella sp.]
MSRRAVALAVAFALVAVGLGVAAFAWRRDEARLVRVGGAANPCSCSMRIEP